MHVENPDFNRLAARITFEENRHHLIRIVVVGVGGGGGNAINRMIQAGIKGVDLVAANTDIQALGASQAPIKIQIGAKVTGGLGCGGVPELGRQAALEDTERLLELFDGADMVFITGGLGGGTCTGAGPVIASLAADAGALTVAVVTTPFSLLGQKRRRYADEGIREFRKVVDTLITVPNENLIAKLDSDALLQDSSCLADDVLCQAVQGISDIIIKPGIVNADFADVRTVMSGKGVALMGTAVGEGPDRASEAARRAILNPLLEEMSLKRANAVLMSMTGRQGSLKLHEARAAAGIIEELLRPDDMILGIVYDDGMGERIKITIIATDSGETKSEILEQTATPVASTANVAAVNSVAQARGFDDAYRATSWEDLEVPAFKRRLAR